MVFARCVAKTCKDQAVGAMFVSKNRSDSSKKKVAVAGRLTAGYLYI